MRVGRSSGFTLIELLLVIGLVALLTAIAVPGLVGAREDAKRKGDAQAGCKALQMMLETRKSETGIYGPDATYTWNYDGSGTPLANIPFQTQGNTKMNYSLTIANTGLTYNLVATEASTSKKYFETDQTLRQIFP